MLRGSMDPVHERGPWTWSTEGVHGPGVHVLYFPFDSWLVKIRADFGSAQNIQLVHAFFARTELLALAGVESLVFVGRKRDRGKTKSSSVVVGDFCSLSV